MSISQRRSPRVPIQLEVDFNHEDTGNLCLITKDISDTGIFIKMPKENHPPIGTTAQVKLKNNFEDGEEPPLLQMKVIRHTANGIGLEFIL